MRSYLLLCNIKLTYVTVTSY